MPTLTEHRIQTYTIDPQTSVQVPTTITFLVDHKKFERTRAALAADRGAGDSYYRGCNSPGFNPCDFKYVAKLEEIGLPMLGHWHHLRDVV